MQTRCERSIVVSMYTCTLRWEDSGHFASRRPGPEVSCMQHSTQTARYHYTHSTHWEQQHNVRQNVTQTHTSRVSAQVTDRWGKWSQVQVGDNKRVLSLQLATQVKPDWAKGHWAIVSHSTCTACYNNQHMEIKYDSHNMDHIKVTLFHTACL